MSEGLRHGDAVSSRNDKYGFDKYRWPASASWPSGLEIQIYDDGRVKVGGWHTSVTVQDVSNYRTGSSNASGHVIAQFRPAPDNDNLAEATATEKRHEGNGIEDPSAESSLEDESLSDDDAYERATWAAIAECKNLRPPYEPVAWIEMIRRWGAAEAARRLLISGDIQDGFRRLIAANRHDLTVEWSVLQPRWRYLFGHQHQEAARWRLEQAGIQPPKP